MKDDGEPSDQEVTDPFFAERPAEVHEVLELRRTAGNPGRPREFGLSTR